MLPAAALPLWATQLSMALEIQIKKKYDTQKYKRHRSYRY